MHEIPAEAQQAYPHFEAFTRAFFDPQHGLGGRLFYAGTLDQLAHPHLRAAGIAGAASFAVHPDPAALRVAMREGIVDFAVTNLDEALRILKNEVRKRQPVSVGIQAEIAAVEQEMRARGVEPDLAAHADSAEIEPAEWIVFSIAGLDAAQVAAIDTQVLGAFSSDDHRRRRWYRSAPRYLGRKARMLRTVCCDPLTAGQVRASLRAAGVAL